MTKATPSGRPHGHGTGLTNGAGTSHTGNASSPFAEGLEAAYTGLEAAQALWLTARQAKDEAENLLLEAETALLLAGVEGRNAEERRAALTHSLTAQRNAVDSATDGERRAAATVELARARLSIEKLKAQAWLAVAP